MVYTQFNQGNDDIVGTDWARKDICGLTGCNSIFYTSSWSSESGGQYHLNLLRDYGKPVFLSLGGSTSNAKLEWLWSAAKKTLGNQWIGLFLRDEPLLEDTAAGWAIYNDIQREVNCIRAIDSAMPIILNTTSSARNYVGLNITGITAHCIDNYLNRGTTIANFSDFATRWKAERDTRAPGRKLAHIGQMHHYVYAFGGVTYTYTLALAQQMYNAIHDVWGDDLYLWGQYAWRNTVGIASPGGEAFEQHPRDTPTVRAPAVEFAQWYYGQSLPNAIQSGIGTTRASTCGGGSTTYVTLDSGASASDDAYNGQTAIVTIDGDVQVRPITDYDGALRRATVSPAFTVAPDSNDTYVIRPASYALGNPAAGLLTLNTTAISTTVGNVVAMTASGTAGIDISRVQLRSGTLSIISTIPTGSRSWNVTALAEGTCTLRLWQNNGYYQDITVTVAAAVPGGLLTISPRNIIAQVGDVVAMTATGTVGIDISAVTLVSGTAAVISAIPTGSRSWNVTALAAGVAVFRLTQNNGESQTVRAEISAVVPPPVPEPGALSVTVQIPVGVHRLVINIERKA